VTKDGARAGTIRSHAGSAAVPAAVVAASRRHRQEQDDANRFGPAAQCEDVPASAGGTPALREHSEKKPLPRQELLFANRWLEGQFERELNATRAAASQERVTDAYVAGGGEVVAADTDLAISRPGLKSVCGWICDERR